MRSIIVLALTCSFVVTTGCTNVPRQVVSITRTLQDYSARLGDTHQETARLYHERVEELNRAWHRRTLSATAGQGAEAAALRQRLAELESTYALVASALDEVLRADPSLPRAGMFDRGEALQLAVMMMTEKERADRSNIGKSDARLEPVDELELETTAAEISAANDRLRFSLEQRITTEYDDLDRSFDDLIAYFRAGLRTRSERKEVLRASQLSAQRLDEDARAAKPLLRGPDLYEAFDASVETVEP